MGKYTKNSLTILKEFTKDENYYMPKSLFGRKQYGDIRLETKMAYVAILDTLLKKPIYNKDNIALVKSDNPEMIRTLSCLTNKEVTIEKMRKYFLELVEASLIVIEKQDIYVMEV